MIVETATGAVLTKTKSLSAYFLFSAPIVGFVEFMGLDLDFLLIWGILIVVDTLLGWGISIWRNEFSSRSAQDRGMRKIILVTLVFCFGLVGTQHEAIAFLAKSVLITFVIAELISILRHGYTLYFRERLPESEVIKSIFLAIFGVLSGMVKIILNGLGKSEKK